jgi:hypothetical protein
MAVAVVVVEIVAVVMEAVIQAVQVVVETTFHQALAGQEILHQHHLRKAIMV